MSDPDAVAPVRRTRRPRTVARKLDSTYTIRPMVFVPGAEFIAIAAAVRGPQDLALGRSGGSAIVGPRLDPNQPYAFPPGTYLVVVGAKRKPGTHPADKDYDYSRIVVWNRGSNMQPVTWSHMYDVVAQSGLPQPVLDKARMSPLYLVAAYLSLRFSRNPVQLEAQERGKQPRKRKAKAPQNTEANT